MTTEAKKPTLKVNDTPSEQVVAQARAEVSTEDALGRKITLRKPGVLAQYRLIEAIGDSASNRVYLAMVMPLNYVASIDGDPVEIPTTKRQIEALIQRLGDEGVDSVIAGVNAHFGIVDPEDEQESLKK